MVSRGVLPLSVRLHVENLHEGANLYFGIVIAQRILAAQEETVLDRHVRYSVLWRPLFNFGFLAVIFLSCCFISTLSFFSVFFVTGFFFVVLFLFFFDISVTCFYDGLVRR
jgi:hypothetical protein